MRSRIMYIDRKDCGERGSVEGAARIGRVRFSKSGRTLYYRDKAFESAKGAGFLFNYYDTTTREEYSISGCRKDGCDGLYAIIVEIDDDVREEYWRTIRNQSERVADTYFRSPGKHTKSGPVR